MPIDEPKYKFVRSLVAGAARRSGKRSRGATHYSWELSLRPATRHRCLPRCNEEAA
jgi:hypothetical protein